MDRETIANNLAKFVPEKVLHLLTDWIITYKINLTVKPRRSSINGDYKAPYRGVGHRISVNANLNKYSFLLTFDLLGLRKVKVLLTHVFHTICLIGY